MYKPNLMGGRSLTGPRVAPEHRSMGAGLRHNLGLPWGPRMYTCMTSKENLKTAAELSARKASKDRKRKGTDLAEEKTSTSRLATAFQLEKRTVDMKAFNLMKYLKT